MRRILITGSRDWTDRKAIFDVLYHELATYRQIVIIHGACPSGADAIAHDFHLANWRVGVAVSRHPADWERDCDQSCYHKPRLKNGKPYCPMAGHLRNQLMVDLGADICYAFPLPDSRGTKDCIRRAKKAGIKVEQP